VPDARRVGEGEGSDWWERRPITRRHSGREGGWNGCLSDTPEESKTLRLEKRTGGRGRCDGNRRCDLSCTQCRCIGDAYFPGYTLGSTALYQGRTPSPSTVWMEGHLEMGICGVLDIRLLATDGRMYMELTGA
jgi:hypothetical protein